MAQYLGRAKGIRSELPAFDMPRQLLPTVLTVVEASAFHLFYFEACNNTGGDVTVTVFDKAGLVLVPAQVVTNGGLLTYRSDFGTPMNGLAWIASAPGIVGWFCGAYT